MTPACGRDLLGLPTPTLMTANLPLLLVALILLCIPRQWLRLGSAAKKRKQKSAAVARAETEPWNTREPGDPRVRMSAEFAKVRNYVDLLRAGAASLALSGGLGIPPVISVGEDAPRNAIWGVIAIRSVILLVGLLIQTVRYGKGQLRFAPPIFYIAGLSLGLCDISGAVAAFVFIWAIHVMFGGAQSFLTAYSVLIVAFGHIFARRGDLSVMLAGILCFLPVLLSLLAGRPLVIQSRRGTRSDQ